MELSHTSLGKAPYGKVEWLLLLQKLNAGVMGTPPSQLRVINPDSEPCRCRKRIQTATYSKVPLDRRLQGRASGVQVPRPLSPFSPEGCHFTERLLPPTQGRSYMGIPWQEFPSRGRPKLCRFISRHFQRGWKPACSLVFPSPSFRSLSEPTFQACHLGTQRHRNCGN